jgi:Flp pilus assembly protein CpaB
MSSEVNADMLICARAELVEVMESMGNISLALREAKESALCRKPAAAAMSVEDALVAIDEARSELLKIRDKAGRWAAWAEGKEAP